MSDQLIQQSRICSFSELPIPKLRNHPSYDKMSPINQQQLRPTNLMILMK